MRMEYWSPGLVRAYALEMMLEAMQQPRAIRSKRPRRRLRTAFAQALRSTGSLLVWAGDRLAAHSPAPLAPGCG